MTSGVYQQEVGECLSSPSSHFLKSVNSPKKQRVDKFSLLNSKKNCEIFWIISRYLSPSSTQTCQSHYSRIICNTQLLTKYEIYLLYIVMKILVHTCFLSTIFLKDLLLEVRNASPLPKIGRGLGPGNLSPSFFILEFGAQNLCHKYNKTISRTINKTIFTFEGNYRLLIVNLKIFIVFKNQLNGN